MKLEVQYDGCKTWNPVREEGEHGGVSVAWLADYFTSRCEVEGSDPLRWTLRVEYGPGFHNTYRIAR